MLINEDNIFNYESDFDWHEPKLVVNLMNFTFHYLLKNYENKSFRYTVSNLEMEYIDLKKWTVLEQNEETTLLECELKDSLQNIMDGFTS